MRKKVLVLLAGLVTLVTPVYGTIIDGSTLNFSADLLVGAVSTTFQCNQPGDSACVVPPSGKGDFAVAASTGNFAPYNGTFGLIKDFNNATQPLQSSFSLPNFLTFDLDNTETVELTFLPIGTDTVSINCAGLPHCTPQNFLLITSSNPSGLSNFDLDSNLNGTLATFAVQGILHDTSGQTGTVSGTFTSEYVGLDPQQTLVVLDGGGTTAYMGQLTVSLTGTVPEPATIPLIVLGLSALAATKRRSHQ